jgi:hypothetical protein
MRDIAIKEITEKYKLANAFLNKSFEERRMIIEKEFEVIDKGLKENNFELVNTGLLHITAIVKENPFKHFQLAAPEQRHKMIEAGELSVR